MKKRYEDLMDALRDAHYPLAILIGQHQRDGFGSDGLCGVDIQILYTIQDELRHMIDRVRDRRRVVE